jgi:3-hydroxyisobutyrate dehydrogenase-like beta-hydroxyacid dehydrogenase
LARIANVTLLGRVEDHSVKPQVVVALLGLGEAGGAIAADLVACGVVTRGWDPDPTRAVEGVERASSPGEAVANADVVLSVNAQAAAVSAARSVAGSLTARHLYADLNTTSAEIKRQVAAAIAPTGAAFVDVALLAPVPGNGVRTPCLASGPGAARFEAIFRDFGMPVETLGDVPGDAATRKLLRSIFTKGLAAAIIESLSAAEIAGCEPWLRAQIVSVLTAADQDLVDRLVRGSRQHARRRVDEMAAAAAVVADLGLEPRIAMAAADVLRALAESE